MDGNTGRVTGKVWYVSGTLTSTRPFFRALGCTAFVVLMASCAAPPPPKPILVGKALGPEVAVPSQSTLPVMGGRCANGACLCRPLGANEVETVPPPDGWKRLEIRMSAAGGSAAAEISGLGVLTVMGDKENCAYIDVPAGSTYDVTYVSKEQEKGGGVAPRMQIEEYGPKGPYWYDMININCDGYNGRCDRNAADAWGDFVKKRKRGRLDPCGSGVVTKLAWDTTGSEAARDGGLFRDFSVRFTMEIKKFPTQFAPGSTECVPK